MDYYIDIQIQPDAEISENVLMNKVYIKLHKVLFDLKSTSIGISFPEYKVLLGRKIRLHGNSSMLNDLQGLNWLGGLSGYCQTSEILLVPENVQYRIVSRKQSTMTNAKLNRLIKRGTIPEENIKAYKAKMFTKGLDNPYFELDSTSNDQLHRRYIQFSEVLSEPVKGDFDHFGLSKTATVPWF